MATPEALIKKMKSESLAKIKTMSAASRKKLVNVFEKWFEWDWEEDGDVMRVTALRDPKALHAVLWEVDQIASDGGLLDFLVENKIIKETAAQRKEQKAPAKKTPAAKAEDSDEELLDGMTKAEAQNMIGLLNKKTGSKVTIGDFTMWMSGEGKGSVAKFDAAVKELIGQEAFSVGEGYARLPNLVYYALGLGPDKVGGISMKSILKNNPKGKSAKISSAKKPAVKPTAPAAKAKPASSAAISKAKEQLKAVNTGLSKLKNVKAVQNFIKLAKMQARLKAKIG